MNLVILDGYTLNPGNLSWEKLEAFGNLTVYPRTKKDEVIERAKDADIIFTNKTVIEGWMLEQLPKLKYIGVFATGYNVVDIEAARKHGIAVTNVPGYSTASVAQHVFALLLEISLPLGCIISVFRKANGKRVRISVFLKSHYLNWQTKHLELSVMDRLDDKRPKLPRLLVVQ